MLMSYSLLLFLNTLNISNLSYVMPNLAMTAQEYKLFITTCVNNELLTPKRAAAFLMILAVESNEFNRYSESFTGYTADRIMQIWPNRYTRKKAEHMTLLTARNFANTVYGNRMGNNNKDDGWTFRGRGPIMLTGRYNYKLYGDLLGLNLIKYPDKAAIPKIGFKIAVEYFKQNGLIALADSGDIAAIVKKVTGGKHNLNRYKKYYDRSLALFYN